MPMDSPGMNAELELITSESQMATHRRDKRAVRAVVALAREHTATAIQRLSLLLFDKDPRIVLDAAEALLNRGWGKAPMTMALTTTDNLNGSPLTLEQKIALLTQAAPTIDPVPPVPGPEAQAPETTDEILTIKGKVNPSYEQELREKVRLAKESKARIQAQKEAAYGHDLLS